MSKSTEELNRQIRRQASELRGKPWSDADRMTNVYLLLELARTILEEYSPPEAEVVRLVAVQALVIAQEMDRREQ